MCMYSLGCSGLLDPCERDQVDSIAYLTPENREVVTYTAQVTTWRDDIYISCDLVMQHMLRQIAFGKLHSVLGVEPLPPEESGSNKRASTSDSGAPATKVAKTDK